MRKYRAYLKAVGKDVEEEVTLVINGLEVTCFAGICPYEIYEGNEYSVAFELMVFDEYEVAEAGAESKALERIGDGFSYWVQGKLSGGVIDCGILFEDEVLLSDYGYLDGKYVRMRVDRIDVEFL